MLLVVLTGLFGVALGAGGPGSGTTFETRCLSKPWYSGYINDQCVVAVEQDSASPGQVSSACQRLGLLHGVSATPFSLSSEDQKKVLESYRMIKQTGFYYGSGDSKIMGTKGNLNTAVGYLCSFADPIKCNAGWTRHREYCYMPLQGTYSYQDGIYACSDASGFIPSVHDDEQNKWLATFASKEIFRDRLGRNPIWLGMSYVSNDNVWKYELINNHSIRADYMRWLTTDQGVPTTLNPPATFSQTILYAGINDATKVGVFGYWDTAKPTDQYSLVCQTYLGA